MYVHGLSDLAGTVIITFARDRWLTAQLHPTLFTPVWPSERGVPLTIDHGQLRVVSWNIEHNGRGRDGGEDNRRLAHSILAEYEPHIVFRQELT